MEEAQPHTNLTSQGENTRSMEKGKSREKIMMIVIVILSIACLTLFITTIVFSTKINQSREEEVPDYAPVTSSDFETNARLTMPSDMWNFVQDGATNQRTQKNNVAAFSRYKLRPKVLEDVSDVRPGIATADVLVHMPLGLAGTSYMDWVNKGADVKAIQACDNYGLVMLLSDQSSTKLERLVHSTGRFVWQEIHLYKDRKLTQDFYKTIIHTAKVKALVVTVNSPALGISYNKRRGKINFPSDIPPHPNFPEQTMEDLIDPSKTWAEFRWLKNMTNSFKIVLPIIVRGILSGEDAKLAMDNGAYAVMVSNNGGRNLDDVPAALDVLADVVKATKGTIPVYMEGGVRSGADILKAVLLGAKMVFITRPMMWALHHSGLDGLRLLLSQYREELINAMQFTGIKDVNNLPSNAIVKPYV